MTDQRLKKPISKFAGFHVDERLKTILEQLLSEINADWDNIIIIDGEEGAGKSTIAMQIAHVMSKKLDKEFTVDNVIFNPEKVVKKLSGGNKEVYVWDEAFKGANSARAMSNLNQRLMEVFMEARSNNHTLIMVMPWFYLLDKYYILQRAKFLLHVVAHQNSENERERGYAYIYPRSYMRKLYIEGKKAGDYQYQKHVRSPHNPVQFGPKFPIDREEYEKKKHQYRKRQARDQNVSWKKYQKILKEHKKMFHKLLNDYTQEEVANIMGINSRATVAQRKQRDFYKDIEEDEDDE